MISLAVTAIAAASLIGLYALYQFLLPKPIPGIPYNAKSANRLLGDIPNLISELSKGGDFVEWLADQHIKSNSAIRQIFLRPFGRPMILLADYRECRELMVFRTKDFDRSQDVSSMLRPVVRTNQFAQPTGSDWKLHRRLVQDTMSPAFLQDVAAPSIYESCLRFIDLWNIKADLANGRPFAALDDFFYATFDAVGAFTFGSAFPYSATKPQADGLAQLAADDFVSDDIDKPIDFPQFDIDENITSMIRLVDGIERAQSSPSPALAWLMTKASSSFRRARRIKDECIRREIEKAVASAKKNEASEDEAWVRNAVDHIIDRENKLAERENRKPDYFSQIITDEVSETETFHHWLEVDANLLARSTALFSLDMIQRVRLCAGAQSFSLRIPVGKDVYEKHCTRPFQRQRLRIAAQQLARLWKHLFPSLTLQSRRLYDTVRQRPSELATPSAIQPSLVTQSQRVRR